MALVKQALVALALVLAASATALAVNALRPDPLPLVQDWDETMARRSEKQLPGGTAALDLKRMTELYRSESVVVLDARPGDFFQFEHIPGARNLPLEDADRLIPELLQDLPPGVRLITYCDGVSCPKARELGLKLVEAGHKDVAVFVGGIEEWTLADLPVASGPEG
ncbi:MAG: rhodanese-like domain-containing protein [Thermodesulfobacteriota bacterium]